jgi:hypothetical protein
MDATCRDCEYTFRYDPEFFSERGLQPPRRCPNCRAQRRAQRDAPAERFIGRVAYVHPNEHKRFGFLLGPDGATRHYFTLADVRPSDLPLTARDVVEFELDDRSERPRARVIRRVQGA